MSAADAVAPTVLIVDDEPPARAKLRAFLEEDGRVAIVGEAGNGMEAVATIEGLRPDLVFLDIQMPELDGFGVLAALEPDAAPRVIFVTAYDQFAVRAFEVRAIDYLLKPFDRDRFAAALERALEAMPGRDVAEERRRIDAVLDAVAAGTRLERFLVRSRGRMYLVPVESVDWIGAAGNYVEIHADGERHLVRGTLAEVADRLDPAAFARVHRSTVVNVGRIREIHPWSHGDLMLVLADGTELRMSRRYRDAIPGTFGG